MKQSRTSIIAVTLLLVLAIGCNVDGDPDGIVTDVTLQDVGVLDSGGNVEPDVGTPVDVGVVDDGVSVIDDVVDDVSEDTTADVLEDATEDVAEGDDIVPETDTPCECHCDDLLCTSDDCDETCDCSDERFDNFFEEAVGLLPPDFELVDANPESATYDQSFQLEDLADTTIILVVHGSNCADCLFQGQSLRGVWDALKDEEGIWLATLNWIDDVDSVMDYVNAYATEDSQGYPLPPYPAPSTWPVLLDTDEQDVIRRYCGDNNHVYVIGGDGLIYKIYDSDDMNFKDAGDRDTFIALVRNLAAATNP